MNISATDLNKRPGTYMETAIHEPVVVEKAGRPSVVMISYKRFLELEDSFWGHRAEQIETQPEYLSLKDSLDLLKAE